MPFEKSETAARSCSVSKKEPRYRFCDPKRFAKKSHDRKHLKKAVRRYYHKQSLLLQKYKEDRDHLARVQKRISSEEDPQAKALERKERILERATFVCNFCLLVGKVVAAYVSGSLSIFSSVVDSAVDMTSGVVVWLSSRAIRKRDPYHYPRGRTRLEPLGLIIISVIMGIASFLVVLKTIESIFNDTVDPRMAISTKINGTNDTITEVDWRVSGPMVGTLLVKASLCVVCYVTARESPTIMVLAKDHRNDCLSNSVAIACGFLGYFYWRYIDAIGAILVSIYIVHSWIVTGADQTAKLTGRTAPPYFVSRIIKICLDHSDDMLQIDVVSVYHFGTEFIVEVDIVLNEDMTVRRARDISELLQRKIESLPDVERAFVHVEHQTKHTPMVEHKLVKQCAMSATGAN